MDSRYIQSGISVRLLILRLGDRAPVIRRYSEERHGLFRKAFSVVRLHHRNSRYVCRLRLVGVNGAVLGNRLP
jgi:hypothetical protein